MVNNPACFQPVHAIENLARTHAYATVWSENPTTLADIDDSASAGGTRYGLCVRSSLFAIPNFKKYTGQWIASGLDTMSVAYSATPASGSLHSLPSRMGESLSELAVLFRKYD